MENSNEILFSLLVICYNHERFIKSALESVLAQKYKTIEIVICDDFSTDSSWEIIQSYIPRLREKFDSVVAFKNSHNLGLTPSLNRMINKANGDIVFFLSGDDMMAESYTTDIVEAYHDTPKASVFVSNGYLVEETIEYSQMNVAELPSYYQEKPDLSKNTLFEHLYWHNYIFAPGVSFKREVFEKYGLYDTEICIEDLEYWLRITVAKEVEFVYIDKKIVFYRKNQNSASSIVENDGFIERRLIILSAIEKIIDKYGKYVMKKEYAKKKWQFLIDELYFYRVYIPTEDLEILRKKMGPFIYANWKVLGYKQLIRYYHIYMILILKRMKLISSP